MFCVRKKAKTGSFLNRNARFVMTIPTIMVFKNGEMVEKVVGVRSKKDFAAMLDKHL